MIGDSDVIATFAARPAFDDVAPERAAWEAIGQLAARGVIRGYGDGVRPGRLSSCGRRWPR